VLQAATIRVMRPRLAIFIAFFMACPFRLILNTQRREREFVPTCFSGTMTRPVRYLTIGTRADVNNKRRLPMLGWAIAFFILAIVAAVLGFGGIAGASAGIAKILFFVFLALLVLSFVVRAVNGRNVS
jgi:uncharacterized membrane protein YtjA (UPF0391 family)